MIPHPGQIVLVRNRPAIVKDLKKSTVGQGEAIHGVWFDYIDGYLHPESDFVIWERELHNEVIQNASLPEIGKKGIKPDLPEDFSSFINAYRWSGVANINNLTTSSIKDINIISPWQSAIYIENYQLYPILKALSQPRVTLLLADDVGLGKTIEAGLILNELVTRGRIRRVMIICPASLQIQWKDEMKEKFYIDFKIIDRDSTYKHQKEYGIDSNPFSSYPRIITSMDYLRQGDVLESFLSASARYSGDNEAILPWDMLILDEAHNVAPKYFAEDTERLKMMKKICPIFENKLFLTATPHNGYTASFTGLLELLNPLVFDQKTELEEKDYHSIQNFVVRRLKSELNKLNLIRKFSEREILRVDTDFRLTKSEKALFAALKEYKNAVIEFLESENIRKHFIIKFLLTLLTKRLLSSVYAFANTWWIHFSGIEGDYVSEEEVNYHIRKAESELTDDDEKDLREQEAVKKVGSWLSKNSDKFRKEINKINDILNEIGFTLNVIQNGLDSITCLSEDSKWNSLVKWIKENLKTKDKFKEDERVIIFTEYKHTLDYLTKRLNKIGIESPSLALLYGGMSTNDREEIKNYFNDALSPMRILLATDVASEGINLQNNCRYVIHYEIPWNPTRLEQRNGRVDRFGQFRDVKVFHFVSDEEDDLKFLERVVNKVEQIREDLGSVSDLLDYGLTNYFLGNETERNESIEIIEKLVPKKEEKEDLKKSDCGSVAEYENVIQNLQATELKLGLNSKNMSALLNTAVKFEKGILKEREDEEDIYYFDKDPPGWKNIIDNSLIIKTGRNSGGKSKIVFNNDKFQKIENNRYIYISRPDTKLIRIGHPLMKKSIGILKRKLWGTGSLQDNQQDLSRFTLSKVKFPSNVEIIWVLHLLVEAINKAKEIFHEETISVPIFAAGTGISIVNNNLWNEINKIERKNLVSSEISRIFSKIQELWRLNEKHFKQEIEKIKNEYEDSFKQKLKEFLKNEKSRVKKTYEERLNELKEQTQSKYIKKLQKELKEQRSKLMQETLFIEVRKKTEEDIRNLELNLDRIISEKLIYLENILETEKKRILEKVLPNRFELNFMGIYPLGIEILINENILRS